jgi:NAD-dependent dihydropyrimidine dehydrogenase PreA subunit
MARKIDPELCIACGICAADCPEEAISESGDTYVIDPEKCSDCGTCEESCPQEAISEA